MATQYALLPRGLHNCSKFNEVILTVFKYVYKKLTKLVRNMIQLFK